jgi:hypothetical protein
MPNSSNRIDDLFRPSVPAKERIQFLAESWKAIGISQLVLVGTESPEIDTKPEDDTATRACAHAIREVSENRVLRQLASQLIDSVHVHREPVASGPPMQIRNRLLHIYQSGLNWSLYSKPVVCEVFARAVFDWSRRDAGVVSAAANSGPMANDPVEDFVTLFGSIVANDPGWCWPMIAKMGKAAVHERQLWLLNSLAEFTNLESQTWLLSTQRPLPIQEWTEQKNSRRCDLIDKKIEGALTDDESHELEELQRQAREYRDRVTPLPIDGARQLHQTLLAKKREAENSK